MQLHAKDGRGLIFEKKDGSVKANLSDEDRQMLQDVNAQISQQLAQQERERERERERQRLEKQRRRGRGFSR